MSQTKRQKEKNRLPPFVALTWILLNSQAFIDLTPSAAKALPYFIGKGDKAWKEKKKEVFEFTYAEARRLGFATRTFSRCITELVEKGFIEIKGYGGLRGFCKTNSLFSTSTRWREYGKPDFQNKRRYPSEPGGTG